LTEAAQALDHKKFIHKKLRHPIWLLDEIAE
jgi:hypothetical protein